MSILEGKRNLVDLNDVDTSTPFADGEAPVWDSTTQMFVPGTASSQYSDTTIPQIKWYYDLVGGQVVTTGGVAWQPSHLLGPATLLNISPGVDGDGFYLEVSYDGWYEIQYDMSVGNATDTEIIVELLIDSGSGFAVQGGVKGYYYGA